MLHAPHSLLANELAVSTFPRLTRSCLTLQYLSSSSSQMRAPSVALSSRRVKDGRDNEALLIHSFITAFAYIATCVDIGTQTGENMGEGVLDSEELLLAERLSLSYSSSPSQLSEQRCEV